MITIVTFSTGGNTAEAGELIQEEVNKTFSTKLYDYNFVDLTEKAKMDVFLDQSEIIVLGTYTWGDGELPSEVSIFLAEYNEILKDKRMVVFGTGDNRFKKFCKAVDILSDRFKDNLMVEPIKINLAPRNSQSKLKLKEFAENIISVCSDKELMTSEELK